MDGTLDPWDFTLARALRMSLTEVRALPNLEHVQWRAYFTWEREMRKLDG